MIKEKVEKIINELRPFLQGDGGDVELVEVNEQTGEVKVKLQGACHGCPMATMTLSSGIEARLKEEIPEVTKVTSVEE